MRISIIVPAFNEERGLAATLASIRTGIEAFHAIGWQTELIVCDNNSTDRTSEIARQAEATVVFEPINQIARARNTGAAAATGDWFVFVDADSHPSRELFADVAAAIRQGDCIAGGSTMTFDRPPLAVRIVTRIWNAISLIKGWAAGSFVFCEAATFREAGGFSLQFYAGEEIDLFRRLKRIARRKGKRVIILHRHPLRTSDRKYYLYTGREGAAFALKTILTRGRTLRRVEDCYQWYDGRR